MIRAILIYVSPWITFAFSKGPIQAGGLLIHINYTCLSVLSTFSSSWAHCLIGTWSVSMHREEVGHPILSLDLPALPLSPSLIPQGDLARDWFQS